MTARRDDTPPKSVDTSTGRTSYRAGRSPWENPGAWLQIYRNYPLIDRTTYRYESIR